MHRAYIKHNKLIKTNRKAKKTNKNRENGVAETEIIFRAMHIITYSEKKEKEVYKTHAQFIHCHRYSNRRKLDGKMR